MLDSTFQCYVVVCSLFQSFMFCDVVCVKSTFQCYVVHVVSCWFIKTLRVMKLSCCVMLVHKKTLRVMKLSCFVMLVHKKTLRVMKLSCFVMLVHKKTLRVIQSCYRLLVHKKILEWRWMNSNDLEYELIRLVWSGRFQWCIIYKSKSGTYSPTLRKLEWLRSDYESDLKVTICLICLQFAIFYLLNKARIEIRLIRSKKAEFSSWPRMTSSMTSIDSYGRDESNDV